MENFDSKKELELGCICFEKSDQIGARKHWLNVPDREDNVNSYGRAQFNLGVSYDQEGDIQRAREHWLNVPDREDDVNSYGKAQFNLGVSYHEEGDIQRAREHWLNVPDREDDFNNYGKAQFNLGVFYYEEGDIQRARAHWKKVPDREDDFNNYGKAQFNLGFSYDQEDDIQRARAHWKKVPKRENDFNSYGQAQFNLGFSYGKKGGKKRLLEHWKNLLNIQCFFQKEEYNDSLRIYNAQKVADYFKDKTNKKNRAFDIYEFIESIENRRNNILEKLYIDGKKGCEKNVAHYTRADVARIIIRSGYFQLGVSNHMNDSLEGKILLESFNILMCYNNDLLAFLTSFTFNENSLNQFRLYGKEDNKDGTGVSLVVQKNFFDLNFKPEKLSGIISISDSILPEKLPLFRCIYIDPKTNCVSVASKSKASFYDLMKNEENIEGLWEDYSKKVNDLSKDLGNELQKIKGDIEQIKNLINKLEHENSEAIYSENSEAIYEAIGTTLLPLIYLTKHVAFEEEAECRIFYITSLTNDLIKSSEKERRIYVEYSTKITALDSDNKIYLEKIYLGPKADSKMELILKKDWIDSLDLKSDQHADIPKIEKSTLPLA